MDWLALQLADAAFPTGGFAHSAGLEAAMSLGEVTNAQDLRRFVEAVIWQAASATLPFATSAHRAPERVAELDACSQAFLTHAVANRASRTQGRAFIATCARIFPNPAIAALDEEVRKRRVAGHYGPEFGAALRALAVDETTMRELFLHLALRGVLSAGVRLGAVGPHEAQGIQFDLAPLLSTVLEATADLDAETANQPAPLLDLFASLHDRQYSRLFQS